MDIYQRFLPRNVPSSPAPTDEFAGDNPTETPTHRSSSVYAQLLKQTSDTPASRKVSGVAGIASTSHPCYVCEITQNDINCLAGYNHKSKFLSFIVGSLSLNDLITACLDFKLKDPSIALDLAFAAENLPSKKARDDWARLHGVRWSEMNRVPGYFPSISAPIDPMHNLYLGESFVVL